MLPADVSRCQGIDAEKLPCDIRHKCERYLSLLDAVAADHYTPSARCLCEHEAEGTEPYPFFIPAEEGAE
jgi:hypothetical protein